MGGLLQLAKNIKSRISSPFLKNSMDEQGISPEEREKFEAQINDLLTRSQSGLDTADSKRIQARKNSATLPLVINLAAAAVIAGGSYLLFYLYDRQEAVITDSGTVIVSTESSVIEELRKESELQLKEKEAEISSIQNELSNISREREALQSELENKIKTREAELNRQLAAALEAERLRLTSEGISEEEIQRQLQSLEQQKETEFSQLLEAMQEEARKDLEEQEARIQALEADYAGRLAAAEKEKSSLSENLAREKTDLSERLAALQQTESQKNLVAGQINSYYVRVHDLIETGKYSDAVASLQDLEAFLETPLVKSLPGIEEQRTTDQLTVRAFTSLLEAELAREDDSGQQAGRALEAINSATAYIKDGDSALQEGDLLSAEETYRKAFSEIPALNTGLEQLKIIEENRTLMTLKEAEEKLREGDLYYLQGRYEDSILAYREVLAALSIDTDAADRMILNIYDAGYNNQAPEQLAEKDREITGLKKNNIELTAENRELYEKIRVKDEALTGLSDNLEQANTSIAELQDQVSGLSDLNSILEGNLAQVMGEKKVLEGQLQDNLDTYLVLQDQVKGLNQKVTYLESSNRSLGEEKNSLQATTQTLQNTLEQTHTRVAGLQDQLETKTAALESVDTELVQLRQQYTLVESALKNSKEENQALESRIDSHLSALTALNSQLADSQQILEKVNQWQKNLDAGLVRLKPLNNSQTDTAADSPEDTGDILGMLTTKLQVKQILNTDSVKSVYPNLMNDLDAYLAAYEQEKRTEGQLSSLALLQTILDTMQGEAGETELASAIQSMEDPEVREKFLNLMAEIETALAAAKALRE